MERSPSRAVKKLYELHGLKFISPRLKVDLHLLDKILSGRINISKDKFYDGCDRWLVIFEAILAPLSKKQIEGILIKFNLKKEHRISILQSLRFSDMMNSLLKKNMRPSEVYSLLKPLCRETILFIRLAATNAKVCRRIDHFTKRAASVSLHINGEDLKSLGLEDGKKIGKILREVLMSKLDGTVRTRSQELHLARELARR